MTIGSYRPVTPPRPYLDATRAYADAVRLSADGRKVENWVAGQPFPTVDDNDPEVANKIMFNFASRWWETDDVDARSFDATVDRLHVVS